MRVTVHYHCEILNVSAARIYLLVAPFLNDCGQVTKFAELIISVSFDPDDLWIML